MSSRAVTLDAAAGSTHVMVYSNGPWTASLTEPVKWAALDKLSGEGINDVEFTYSANYAVSRQVGIVFTSAGQRDTVMMTQKGSITEASFIFDNASINLLRSSATVNNPISTNLQYGLDNVRPTIVYSEEMVEEGEEVPTGFEKWISELKVTRRNVSFQVAEHKGDLPRVAYINFEVFDPNKSGAPVTATLIVTQTSADPQLVFESDAMIIGGNEGPQICSTTVNNLWPYADQIKVENEADWIKNVKLTKDGVTFDVLENEGEQARTAQLSFSFTDELGNQASSSFTVNQGILPREITFGDLRNLVTNPSDEVTVDLYRYIDGYVVSDYKSPNVISSPQIKQFGFDREYGSKVVYLESLDGQYGFQLIFDDPKDAKIARYSKVRILVEGLKLSMEANPDRYFISGITSDAILETESGSRRNLPEKIKKISELTDADIFTYVTIPDMEIMAKDGAYTNATDGYSFKDAANPFSGTSSAPRWDVAPLLCTDKYGDAVFMLTNSACTWRRIEKDLAFNKVVPQGSGNFNAIVVHDTQVQVRYGNLGRYQLRYMDPEDLAFDNEKFSKTIVEWNWNNRVADLNPEVGKGSFILNGATSSAAADFNNTYNGRSGDGGNGGATSNQKGLVANGGIKLMNKWWDFSNNTGRYIDFSFSTSGINGNNMVFGIVWGHGAMGNTTLDSPSNWKLLYSVDGGASFKDVPDCDIIKNRSIVWWTTTSQDSCPGFTEHLRKLPTECFGKESVVVRLQVADKVCDKNPSPKAVSDNSYLGFLGVEKATLTDKSTEIRIGTVTVRYN